MELQKFNEWVRDNKSNFKIEDLHRHHPTATLLVFMSIILIPLYIGLKLVITVILFLGSIGFEGPITSIVVFILFILFLTWGVNFVVGRFLNKLEYNEYIACLLVNITNEIEKMCEGGKCKEDRQLLNYLKRLYEEGELSKKEQDTFTIDAIFKNNLEKQENFKRNLRELSPRIYNSLSLGRQGLEEWTTELEKIRTLAWYIFNNDDKMYQQIDNIISTHPNGKPLPSFLDPIRDNIKKILKNRYIQLIIIAIILILILRYIVRYFFNIDDNTIIIATATIIAGLAFTHRK